MLNLKTVMKKLRTKLKIQVELMDKRNKLFPNLRMKNVITENENNYLGSILKKQPLKVSFNYFLKYAKVFLRYLGNQSFPTVEPLLKNIPNSWITIYGLQ